MKSVCCAGPTGVTGGAWLPARVPAAHHAPSVSRQAGAPEGPQMSTRCRQEGLGGLSAPQQSTGTSAWSPPPPLSANPRGLDGSVTRNRVKVQRSERPQPRGCWTTGSLGGGCHGPGAWSHSRSVVLGAGFWCRAGNRPGGTTPRQPWDPETRGRDRRAWVPTGGRGWPWGAGCQRRVCGKPLLGVS